MNSKILLEMVDALESANFGYFAEELCIRHDDSRAAYFYLQDQLKKLDQLFKQFPSRVDELKKEWELTKKKIVLELFKKSLLFYPEPDSLLTLSGNPFPIKQN